jgi:DNA polymerase (family X)
VSALNAQLADLFEDVGNSLQYLGEPWVKVKSYLYVAEVLRELATPVDRLAAEGKLDTIPGVGQAISKKIADYLEAGSFKLLERLDAEVPVGVRALLGAGLAPSLVHHIETLGIDTPEKLEQAIARAEITEASLPARQRARFRDYLARRASYRPTSTSTR